MKTYKILKIQRIYTDQYDLPQNTLTLACFWQWKHTYSCRIGSYYSGTQSVLADPVKEFYASNNPYLVSIADLSLTFYSQCLSSHHGVKTTFFLFSSVMNSYQLLAIFFFSLSLLSAFLNMSF